METIFLLNRGALSSKKFQFACIQHAVGERNNRNTNICQRMYPSRLCGAMASKYVGGGTAFDTTQQHTSAVMTS